MNKKVKNATVNTKDGITFKSLLESRVYSTLLREGFSPLYEPITFTIFPGFKSKVVYYTKETDSQMEKRKKTGDKTRYRMLSKSEKAIKGITYTPDFYIRYNNKNIYIETKGLITPTYPLKRKMFLKYLNDNAPDSYFFEVFTLEQLKQVIDIIKNEIT